MGRPLVIPWQESADELLRRYKQEQNVYRRVRLQALWLLRQGKPMTEVSEIVGMSYGTMKRWGALYRSGGLQEVLEKIPGHQSHGSPSYLSAEQLRALEEQAKTGAFKTIWDAIDWVKKEYGVEYTYQGMWSVFQRLRMKRKRPRPQAVKADPELQEAWKKGGCRRRYKSVA